MMIPLTLQCYSSSICKRVFYRTGYRASQVSICRSMWNSSSRPQLKHNLADSSNLWPQTLTCAVVKIQISWRRWPVTFSYRIEGINDNPALKDTKDLKDSSYYIIFLQNHLPMDTLSNEIIINDK